MGERGQGTHLRSETEHAEDRRCGNFDVDAVCDKKKRISRRNRQVRKGETYSGDP